MLTIKPNQNKSHKTTFDSVTVDTQSRSAVLVDKWNLLMMMKQKAEQSQVEKKKNAESERTLQNMLQITRSRIFYLNNSHSLKLSLNCNL